MSLGHGLLGLLAEGPASGYDLSRRFQQELGQVWPAQHPKIYAELSRLAEAGLIEVDSRGPRGRKAYRITDAGLAEVRRWLAEDEVDHTMRMESLLRSFFFWLMPPEELAAHLERERAFFTETARVFRQFAAAKDRGDFGSSPHTQSTRVAIEAGARLYEALATWAEWARTVPPAVPPATGEEAGGDAPAAATPADDVTDGAPAG
ncbi:PadR family transcriptional regulator [Allostreptomyces psammosilenae]|uniref:DNA-binding PadR family transcriptional regulator n=1 Tax=Allostreptomyces psammosilenae TaxID=1892865 RepID=A0A853A356_9ACTN|nr:PadR family transcriptional regulator [Allostreptomyces psammosilenae]NYI04908.1 DNA-binding PadR family transcriptional regulator [Allostreptomyces psammosilenae]